MKKLQIAVTFFYNEERFAFLEKICSQFEYLAEMVNVHIITNVHEKNKKNAIRSVTGNKNINISISSPTLLGHPYLLPWCHFSIFKKVFDKDSSTTHFMYLEDDILITQENIAYWLKGRENLKKTPFIPSFLRYEKNNRGIFSTDVTQPVCFNDVPKVLLSDQYCYINFSQSYQGMYLLDRELMAEHLRGPSSNPDFGQWHIREKATQGLTFVNVPAGFYSRNLVGFDREKFYVDPDCRIHHLPNNYADNPDSPFGKIPCRALVTP
jgi:hypothetical protein